jgi:hypothetical protein
MGSTWLRVLTCCYDDIGVAGSKLNFGAIVTNLHLFVILLVTACFGWNTRFLP